MKSQAEVKVILPGVICPAHIAFWGGPATRNKSLSRSLSTPILNSQGRISDLPNLGQTPTFVSQEQGRKCGCKELPSFVVLKAEMLNRQPRRYPYGSIEFILYLKLLSGPLSLQLPHPSWAASLVNGLPVSAREQNLIVGLCSILMHPDLCVFPLKSIKNEVSLHQRMLETQALANMIIPGEKKQI